MFIGNHDFSNEKRHWCRDSKRQEAKFHMEEKRRDGAANSYWRSSPGVFCQHQRDDCSVLWIVQNRFRQIWMRSGTYVLEWLSLCSTLDSILSKCFSLVFTATAWFKSYCSWTSVLSSSLVLSPDQVQVSHGVFLFSSTSTCYHLLTSSGAIKPLVRSRTCPSKQVKPATVASVALKLESLKTSCCSRKAGVIVTCPAQIFFFFCLKQSRHRSWGSFLVKTWSSMPTFKMWQSAFFPFAKLCKNRIQMKMWWRCDGAPGWLPALLCPGWTDAMPSFPVLSMEAGSRSSSLHH